MDEEELDAAVADYRSKKRCTGFCDRILPNTDEFFATNVRADRGGRRYVRSKCRECRQAEKNDTDQAIRNEMSKDPGYEMTIDEIAAELGVSKQNVEQTMNRAFKKIRERLRKLS
jgi:sigma-70-like protein